MTQLLSAIFCLAICSSAAAFYKTKNYEVRDNETWVHLTLDLAATAKADLLIVVDNSASMVQHQKHLALQMPLLAEKLVLYSDLNAGVISSTIGNYNPQGPGDNGVLVSPFLNSADPQFANKLAQQVLLGESGNPTEMFFDPLVLATSEPHISGKNAGFLRDDADLIVLFLTETEDQSALNKNPQDVVTHLKTLKPNNTLHTILIGVQDPAKCVGESWEIESKTSLKDFVQLTQGTLLDICSEFSSEIPKALAQMEKNISKIFLQTFPQTTVEFKTIQVTADGQPLPVGDVQKGWTFDPSLNEIILGASVVKNKAYKTLKISYKLISASSGF